MGDERERVLGPGAEGDIDHPEATELTVTGVRVEAQPHVPAAEPADDQS